MSVTRLVTTAAGALLAALYAQGSWAACYIVYGADKQIVYRSQLPPVDMSRPLHETVPRIAPGGTLVFSLDSNGCELEIHNLQGAGAARAGASAARTAPAQRGQRS